MADKTKKPRIDETEYDKLVDQDFIESFTPRSIATERAEYEELILKKEEFIEYMGAEVYSLIVSYYEEVLGNFKI